MKKTISWLIPALAVFSCIFFFVGDGLWTAPALPDLTVALKTGPLTGQILVGQDISSLVRVQVTNRGLSAVSNYAVAVVLSTNAAIVFSPDLHASITTGRMIGQRVVTKSLAPGASEVVSIKPVKIPADIFWGNHFVTVVVDPANQIAEGRENNNAALASCFVLAETTLIEQWYNNTATFIHFNGNGFGPWKSTLVVRVGPYTIPTMASYWSNVHVQAFPAPDLIPVGDQLYDVGLYDGTKAIIQTQKESWGIFLTAVNPASGPVGTSTHLMCANCQAQGTKKLALYSLSYQFVAEVPVTWWTMVEVVGTIPIVPAGSYYLMITDNGQLLTHEYKLTFTVN